jgi:hypothetical protein
LDRWVGVESDAYIAIRGTGPASQAAARAIREVRVDLDDRTTTLTQDEGSQIAASPVPRTREEWPTGCPTNVGSTRMEVLDIEEGVLTIESTAFKDKLTPSQRGSLVPSAEFESAAFWSATPILYGYLQRLS